VQAGVTSPDADTNADYHISVTITHTFVHVTITITHTFVHVSVSVPYDNDTGANRARGKLVIYCCRQRGRFNFAEPVPLTEPVAFAEPVAVYLQRRKQHGLGRSDGVHGHRNPELVRKR
jgi:hypothetical protein